MKKYILLTFFIGASVLTFAQQDLMVSQYMFNHNFLNPAATAVKGNYNASLMYRKQWHQFEGAPVSQFLSIDGPVISEMMGLGLVVQRDQIGVNLQTDILASYSYIMDMDKVKLSMGLRAGASVFQANYTEHRAWDIEDELLQANTTSYLPNFGFGVYLKHDKYYASFSVPHIFDYDPNTSLSLDFENSNQLVRHYYLMGGYRFQVNENFVLEPNTLLKHATRAPSQMDLNLLVEFKQIFALGFGYRTGDSFILLSKVQLNNKFQFGYSFDITMTDIRDYSKGSHEIMLNYSFGGKKELSLPSIF